MGGEINFADGLSFIEIGIAAGALSAILVLIFLIYDRIFSPINERWDDAGKVADIEKKLDQVIEAMRPTNGDSRSLSDRVDVAKRYADEAKNHTLRIDSEWEEWRKNEAKARHQRQRQHDEKMEEVTNRITQLENSITELLERMQGG